MRIREISISDLGTALGFASMPPVDDAHETPSFLDWNMEVNDAPILRYLFRNFRPWRHLEFGTLLGFGACLCLEESEAMVWTINLWEGESKSDGSWVYANRVDKSENYRFAETQCFHDVNGDPGNLDILWLRSDAQMMVGKICREKGLGHRICQIYRDSRDWDVRNYPHDFFNTVLVDGGHQPEVVISDTFKGLSVLRPGGLIMWHDYCPDPVIQTRVAKTGQVVSAIGQILPELEKELQDVFWINPSMILIGIKK